MIWRPVFQLKHGKAINPNLETISAIQRLRDTMCCAPLDLCSKICKYTEIICVNVEKEKEIKFKNVK